jgi:hypothetical protein
MQRRALELMREFESQNIGNTLWAFATLGFNPGALPSLLALLAQKLLSLLALLVALGVRDAWFQPRCATLFTCLTSTEATQFTCFTSTEATQFTCFTSTEATLFTCFTSSSGRLRRSVSTQVCYSVYLLY